MIGHNHKVFLVSSGHYMIDMLNSSLLSREGRHWKRIL